MIVCIARLRGSVRYTHPLEHILDSFYVLLKKYTEEHDEIKWQFYGITFDGSKPLYDVKVVKNADVIIIPTEQEFHYHTPGYFHPRFVDRSTERITAIQRFIKNKQVILLRSDRADGVELFQKYTFPHIPAEYHVIDELDFSYGLHAMKFYFIREFRRNSLFESNRDLDFAYWGSCKNKLAGGEKSSDIRHLILRGIKRNLEIKGLYIGRYIGFKADMPMQPLKAILPHLVRARATLCFNWINPEATTARYHEAIACGIVPFVFGEYDSGRKLAKLDWQHISSLSEAEECLMNLEYDSAFDEVSEGYNPPKLSYYQERFNQLLTRILKRCG